jgi:peptidoglycan/xylan/chitin deacetylase (PgdA/CDA1 family)
MRMRRGASLMLVAPALALIRAECDKPVYLTIDTGSMKPAREIAEILRKQRVRATFFLANEKTWRGDTALDPAWTDFWRALAEDGHAFGSHTWRHWYFRRDVQANKVAYLNGEGGQEALTKAQVCQEIDRPREALLRLTGREMAPLWRAPGGRTTPRLLAFAKQCGWEHVGWSEAGFLGDELPSETHPNKPLLERAIRNIRSGDILMMHLGIRSRRDPFWPMLTPLIEGLRKKGFCFETLPARTGLKTE